jgi:hypothetical protein
MTTEKTYTFSYINTINVPKLVRRPWWNLFGQDHIEYVEQTQRKLLFGLSEYEREIVQSGFNLQASNTVRNLLLRFMGKNVNCVQLELSDEYVNKGVSEYIKTTTKEPFKGMQESVRTNIITNSGYDAVLGVQYAVAARRVENLVMYSNIK